MAPHPVHRIATAALGVLGRIHIFAFILMILGAITQTPNGAGPQRLIFWVYGCVWLAVFAIEWLIIRVVRARRNVDLETAEPTDVQIDAAPEISATRLLIPSLFMLFVGVMLGRLEDIQVLVPSWIAVKVAEVYLRPRQMIIKVRRAASVGVRTPAAIHISRTSAASAAVIRPKTGCSVKFRWVSGMRSVARGTGGVRRPGRRGTFPRRGHRRRG